MGTSASNTGNRGTSPLIPSWSDTSLPITGQEGENKRRFTNFRQNVSRYIRTSDEKYLLQAIRSYLNTSLGGARLAKIRLSGGIDVGGRILFHLLTTGELSKFFSDPDGKSPLEVINKLSETFIPKNGDFDVIHSAVVDSLFGLCKSEDFFEKKITDRKIVTTVIEKFIATFLTHQLLSDAGNVLNKSSDLLEIENKVLEIITVQTHFSLENLTLTKSISELTEEDCKKLFEDILDKTIDFIISEDN